MLVLKRRPVAGWLMVSVLALEGIGVALVRHRYAETCSLRTHYSCRNQ